MLILGVVIYWPARWLDAAAAIPIPAPVVDQVDSASAQSNVTPPTPAAANNGMVVVAMAGILTAFVGALAAAAPPALMMARPAQEYGFGMLAGLGVRFFVTLTVALIAAANLGLVGLAAYSNSYLIWTAGAKFVYLCTGIAAELALARRLAPGMAATAHRDSQLHSRLPEATC